MKTSILYPMLLIGLSYAADIVPVRANLNLVNKPGSNAHLDIRRDSDLFPETASIKDASHPTFGESLKTRQITTVDVRPDASVGSLVGIFKNRLLYFASAKSAKTSVKDVVQKLNKHGGVQTLGHFITNSLLTVLVVILTLAVIFDTSPVDHQVINVGIDDGKEAKVRRRSLLSGYPVDVVNWDLADDDAHSIGNVHKGRSIISDELRTQMLAGGHRNVTFVQHDSPHGRTPAIIYRTNDTNIHYHWRPTMAASLITRKTQNFRGHYAYFNADGAGFKISARNPIRRGASGQPMSDKEAKPIAQAITTDFLDKRSDATFVGYQEQIRTKDKNTNLGGHKLCLIAEGKRFGLQDEFDKCFK